MEHKLNRRIWAVTLLAALLIQSTGLHPVQASKGVLPAETKYQLSSANPTSEGAVTLPVSPAAVTMARSTTQVTNFIYRNHSSLDLYDAVYRYPNDKIATIACSGNQGGYGNHSIGNAIDNNYNTHWETSSGTIQNFVQFTFTEPIDISRIIFAIRQDGTVKGFPTTFEIYGSADGKTPLALVAQGNGAQTHNTVEITLLKTTFKELKFVWTSVDNAATGWASASEFRFYKEDTLESDLQALFTDNTLSALSPGVTTDRVAALMERTKSHPFGDDLWNYVKKAHKLSSLPVPELIPESSTSIWNLDSYSQTQLTGYNDKFLVDPIRNAVVKDGNNTTVLLPYDGDWDNPWSASVNNSATYFNSLTFSFQQEETIGRIIFKGQSNKYGFPTKFKIYSSGTDSGENFKLVTQGSMDAVTNKVEITMPSHSFKRLRFVWAEPSNQKPAANEFAFYKEDTLQSEFQALFIDSSCTALANGVTLEKVKELTTKADAHPLPEIFKPYIGAAKALLGVSGEDSKMREPITLAQKGERVTEWTRTQMCYSLGQFNLTGYYAVPGETLGVYVNADPNGPMPRLVLATANQFKSSWAFDYDGMPLSNGYNEIKAPADMKGCQLIYFYNPAIPADQAFAPVVRLVGGTEYPVYRYNSKYPEKSDDPTEFMKKLEAYENEVTDINADAEAGRGKFNVCELTSDKVIITVSARGAIKGLKQSRTWEKGSGQGTGRTYSGPKDTMELYDGMHDDIMLYSGFNITNPEKEDYKPYSQFLFRAYSNGAGAGWAQHVYSGYNTGIREDNDRDRWDDSFYVTLASVNPTLDAGWTEYHEIGHIFDNKVIGTSESTNNLYGLSGQIKYKGENRLDGSEDRWYNHFTSYINTGILPSNDLLFYPGAVIYQLDAVDFSKTTLYKDEGMSNYGRGCRYTRLHEKELAVLDDNPNLNKEQKKNDKMVVAMSMAAGVDLSNHFEFFKGTISEEARWMIRALPKETRPTWFVNYRTFRGSALTDVQMNTAPKFTHTIDRSNGSVTFKMDETIYVDGNNSDKNLQCFSYYRQDITNPGDPIPAQPEFIGISGNSVKTTENELYTFTDINVKPGHTYKYLVSAYDCTLLESDKSEIDIEIPSDSVVPIQVLRLNTGDEGYTSGMGFRFPLRATYFPDNATVDLNTIKWDIKDNITGAGINSIRIEDDPNYPGDPTRKIIVGRQNGSTRIYVTLGGKTQTYRFVVTGSTANLTKLSLEPENLFLPVGETTVLKEIRFPDFTTTTTPALWTSSDTSVATVAPDGTITALFPGVSNIMASVTVSKDKIITATSTVTVTNTATPATEIAIQPWAVSAATLYMGESQKVTANLTPSNATNGSDLTWNIDSQNPNTPGSTVLELDSAGNLKALSPGTAVLKATVGTVIKTITITVEQRIPVSFVTINKPYYTITSLNETLQLALTVTPANASGTDNIVWKSDNTDIATVDQNGLVTPKTAGQTVVTGFLNGKYASCNVTVNFFVALDGLKFQGKVDNTNMDVNLVEGKGHQLIMTPIPIRATNLSNVAWQSGNESIATVNPLTGYINGVSPGTAVIKGTITQTQPNNSTISKFLTCTVTVTANEVPLTGISINTVSQSMNKGDTLLLALTKRPTTANVGITAAAWTSSAPAIASVDPSSGQVTAHSPGSAIITGKMGSFEITCTIAVQLEVIYTLHSLTMASSEYQLDFTNKAAVIGLISDPADMAPNAFWSSKDTGIAKVDQYGVVTGISTGETTITAALLGKSASCKVIVDMTPPINPVLVDFSQIQSLDKIYDGLPAVLSGTAIGSYTDNGNTVAYTDGFIYTYIGSDGIPLSTPPVNAGTYLLKATVGNSNFTGSATKTFNIFKKDQPIPTGLASIQATNGANDNAKITGLDPGKTYEYRVGNSVTWQAVPANSTELTGLAPESYYIRLAGNLNTDPSTDVCVVIAPYHPEIPALLVNFTSVTADDLDIPKATASLTLSFDSELDGFNKDLVTLQGASKKDLTRLSPTDWKLSISNITVASGESITIRLTDPTGYEIVPSSRKALVYNKAAPSAPDTGNSSSSGSSKPEKEKEVVEEPKEEKQEDSKDKTKKPPKKKPGAVISTNGKENTTAKLDKKGNATITVSNKAITDAIAKARSKAKKNGTEKYGISTEINISVPSSAKTTQVNLPKSVQDKLISANVTDFILTANKVSVTFDLTAIRQIRATAKQDVNVNISKVSANKIPSKTKKTIGNNTVYDFSVTYGNKKITNLGNGKVNIGLPYKPKAKEKKGNLTAVYIDGKGNVTTLRNSSYNKNLGIVLFSTDHFSTYSVLYVADTTSSIFLNSNKHWAKDSLNFAESRNLFEKTGGKMLSPDASITRETLAVALGKLAKINVNKYKDTAFTDVNKKSSHLPYIEWAASEGIIKSTSPSAFSPNKAVTREEMADIMVNYCKATGYTPVTVYHEIPFNDSHLISEQFADSVREMQMTGIMMDKYTNCFVPQGKLTYAELSSMLNRFTELKIDSHTAYGWHLNDSGAQVCY